MYLLLLLLLRKSNICWCNCDMGCRFMGLALDFMSNYGDARSLALQAGCRHAGELPPAELAELRLPVPGATAAAVATSLGALYCRLPSFAKQQSSWI